MERKRCISLPLNVEEIKLQQLPYEILLIILSFFSHSDLPFIMLVCKDLFYVSKDALRVILGTKKFYVNYDLHEYAQWCMFNEKQMNISHLFHYNTFDVGYHMKVLYDYQFDTGYNDIIIKLFDMGLLNVTISDYTYGCLVLLMKNYRDYVITLISDKRVLGLGDVNWGAIRFSYLFERILGLGDNEIFELCLQDGRTVMTEFQYKCALLKQSSSGDEKLGIILSDWYVKRSKFIIGRKYPDGSKMTMFFNHAMAYTFE